MKITLKWKYMDEPVEFDTMTMRLVDIPGRGKRMFGPDEMDAEMCIDDGMNLTIAQVHTGDVRSANALCREIVRRFNEFPEELKQ